MEVNRGLHCRPQDAGDARPIGYLPRRADYREWNPLREVSVLHTGHQLEKAESPNPLTPVMGLEGVMLVLLGLGIAAVQLFLPNISSPYAPYPGTYELTEAGP